MTIVATATALGLSILAVIRDRRKAQSVIAEAQSNDVLWEQEEE
jgi:hypothetical protein